MSTERWLTLPEVARLLDRNRVSVWRNKSIRAVAVRQGRSWRVRVSDLEMIFGITPAQALAAKIGQQAVWALKLSA